MSTFAKEYIREGSGQPHDSLFRQWLENRKCWISIQSQKEREEQQKLQARIGKWSLICSHSIDGRECELIRTTVVVNSLASFQLQLLCCCHCCHCTNELSAHTCMHTCLPNRNMPACFLDAPRTADFSLANWKCGAVWMLSGCQSCVPGQWYILTEDRAPTIVPLLHSTKLQIHSQV